MWIPFIICIFSWFSVIYIGYTIFVLNKRFKQDAEGFICGILMGIFSSYASIQTYGIEYDYEIVTGVTIGLGVPSRGHYKVKYTYNYDGKNYENDGNKYNFNVIYPNGKYEVRVSKTDPSLSRIDFSKPLQ